MSTFYVVATPIGNLDDISNRALETLRDVDVVVSEDTRVTRKLFSHFDIDTPTESYHSHSNERKIDKIIGLLESGKNIAMTSDAGTPTISDPGSRLISAVRECTDDDVSIVAVPGPSAVTAALSVSGLPASRFLFLGFLPHKKGRQTLFEEIAAAERTVVFYESPHRIMKTLNSLADILDQSREVVVAREMTKVHEEVVSGSAEEVRDYYEENADKQRGEFVVMVGGA